MAQNLSSRLEMAEKNFVRTIAITSHAGQQAGKIAKRWLKESPEVVAVRLMDASGQILDTWPADEPTKALNFFAAQELPVNRIALAHAFELLSPTYSALYRAQDKQLVDLFIPIDGANPKMFVLTLDTSQWFTPTDAEAAPDIAMQVVAFIDSSSGEQVNNHVVNLPAWAGLWSLQFQSKDPLVLLLSVIRPAFILLIMLVLASFYWHWRSYRQHQKDEFELLEKSKLLEKQNRLSMLGEMSASLAHEINQPLTSIANYAVAGQMRLQQTDPGHALLPLLQKIQAQTQRAAQVLIAVRGMLQSSPMEASNLDMAELITRLKPHLNWMCSEHGVGLHLENMHAAQVTLSPVLFEQVLINLVKNSVQALSQVQRPQKKITLTLLSENKRLLIQVKDNGPGIPAAVEARIFESFFTTKEDGIGIGLNLCKSVIERFHGQLTLRSNGAEGVCFLIDLPLAPMP